MFIKIKKYLILCAGILCLLLGGLFILLPGPAVIFIPAGLALLSLEYPPAKLWLRNSQRWMSRGAKKADRVLLWLKRSRLK